MKEMKKTLLATVIIALFIGMTTIPAGSYQETNANKSGEQIKIVTEDKLVYNRPIAFIDFRRGVKDLQITGREILDTSPLGISYKVYYNAVITGISNDEYNWIRPIYMGGLSIILRRLLGIKQYYYFEESEFIHITCKYCYVHFYSDSKISAGVIDLKVYKS